MQRKYPFWGPLTPKKAKRNVYLDVQYVVVVSPKLETASGPILFKQTRNLYFRP